jgi:hypothetical protein
MVVYILNAPILTNYGEWKFTGPIGIDQARKYLSQGFESAIGHVASAQFLSQLLGIEIAMSRISVAMEAGDSALILRIMARLPEGQVLSVQEMSAIPYELGWLQRTQ